MKEGTRNASLVKAPNTISSPMARETTQSRRKVSNVERQSEVQKTCMAPENSPWEAGQSTAQEFLSRRAE